jgi:hypothetical protein
MRYRFTNLLVQLCIGISVNKIERFQLTHFCFTLYLSAVWMEVSVADFGVSCVVFQELVHLLVCLLHTRKITTQNYYYYYRHHYC